MMEKKDNEELPRWRQDFPIDLPQDEYVSRRDFTKFLMLVSLAFVVGQFWILFINWKRHLRGQLPLKEISGAENLQTGAMLLFNYPAQHEPCVLVRLAENRYIAYSQKCTHLSCPVIPRPELKQFHCPCHEGSFDMETGRPLAGPPRRALSRVTLKVLNGKIYASGMEGAL
jgi:Rieske Fe-S protein